MQSGAKVTGWPRDRSRYSRSGARLDFGSFLPPGRPKWEAIRSFLALAAMSFKVGSALSIRCVSAILPWTIGTLKSTRTKTLLPSSSSSSTLRIMDMSVLSKFLV